MSLMPILGQLRNRRGNFNLGDPFSALTPDEIRRRMEYERNNPDEFRRTIMPVPIRRVGEPYTPPDVTPVPKPGAYTDRRARPPISVRPVARPQPFQPQPAPPQFGQVEEQPQFNQQGMQQMMQMISQFSNQGGFDGGFGGGYGGGMGGGFGRGYGSMGGPFGQMMGPMPRPTPRFNYFSQSPFGRY